MPRLHGENNFSYTKHSFRGHYKSPIMEIIASAQLFIFWVLIGGEREVRNEQV
jgi:hypothetical protein